MEQGDYNATVSPAVSSGLEDADRACKEWWATVEETQKLALIRWLDEFMGSEEFAEHFERRRNRVDQITEYNEMDFRTPSATIIQGEGDTKKYRRLHLLYDRLQGGLIKKNIRNTIENQKRGIEIIKKKIKEEKFNYLGSIEVKEKRNRKERHQILKQLKDCYNINILTTSTKNAVVEKVIFLMRKYQKTEDRKQQNISKIIKRILSESKRQQQIEQSANKRYDYKVLPSGKFVEGLEIIGEKMTIIQEEEPVEQDVEVPEPELPPEIIEEAPTPKKKKPIKDKRKKKEKKEKKPKKKKEKKSKSTKSKKSNKSDKSKAELVLPTVPIVNKRLHIKAESYNIQSLMKDFTLLNNFLKDQQAYEIEKSLEANVQQPLDKNVVVKPKEIIYKDFLNNHAYKKVVHITNSGPIAKKVKFDKIIWHGEIDDALLLQVEPIGIQKLIPGFGCNVTMWFNPETLQKAVEAEVVFLTYGLKDSNYHHISINVICIPSCSDVSITPTIISFAKVPIWKAQQTKKDGKNFKFIKIVNSGSKECRVVIVKQFTAKTVDSTWSKLISVINCFETEESQHFSSATVPMESLDEGELFPRNLVQECVESVFNTFRFDRNIFNVPGKTSLDVKVWFKNFDHVGHYVETYRISVYERFPDNQLYCIGIQEVIVNAETTGHWLILTPEVLDFEECIYNSAYQLSFEIFNSMYVTHNVRVNVPKSIKDYVTCKPNDFTLQPNFTQKIFVRFTPRKGLIEENVKFYDAETEILEFPIYISIYTRGYEETPSISLDVFAAITVPLGLMLSPTKPTNVNHKEACLLDLDVCSTKETVHAEIELHNTSYVPQQYGFLNLPKSLTIQPNFGFGVIQPMQKKTLRLYFSPTKQDLLQKTMSHDDDRQLFFFELAVTTVKHQATSKKSLDLKKVNRELKKIERRVANPKTVEEPVIADMNTLMTQLKSSLSFISSCRERVGPEEETVLEIITYDESSKNSRSEDVSTASANLSGTANNEKRLGCNKLLIIAHIVDALFDFSHQFVMFPDTPCGSYSVMKVDLNANRDIHVKGNKRISKPYTARFEIFGNSEEITVEPNSGYLKSGQGTKIYLVAKPEIPPEIIEKMARAIKVEQMIEEKRKEMIANYKKQRENAAASARKRGKKADKKDVKKKGKDKASNKKSDKKEVKSKGKKKGKEKSTLTDTSNKSTAEEEDKPYEPEVVIDENDAIVGYFDFYPAEMCVWRSLEPYIIEADFTCIVTYTGESDREQEVHYFKARCRVVQPHFIHNLNVQEIDFGKIAIGQSETTAMRIQNITRGPILPKLSAFCPNGGFSSVELWDTKIPPEFYVNLPITFAPNKEGEEVQFFEIACERSVCQFLVRGVGVEPDVQINPDFLVARLEAPKNVNCTIEIVNNSECSIVIKLSKQFELEGEIKQKPLPPTSPPESPKKTKKKDAKKKVKPPKAKKVEKFSQQLTEDEVYSLEHFFKTSTNPNSLFHVIGEAGDKGLIIEPSSKSTIKILFGNKSETKAVKGKKDGKKGGKKGDKKAEKKSSSKSSKSKSSKGDRDGKVYLAKIAVMLGNKRLLKDFICIGFN